MDLMKNNSSTNYEKILASKKLDNGKLKFLIKLKNQPIEKCKWISHEENLNIPQILIENFEKTKQEPVFIKHIRGRGRPIKDWEKREEFLRIKPKIKLIDKFVECTNLHKKRGRPKKSIFLEDTRVSDHYFEDKSSYSEASFSSSNLIVEKSISKFEKLNEQIDYPEKIKEVKIIKNIKCYLVEWKIRSDGIIPEESFVPCNIFKEKFSEYNK